MGNMINVVNSINVVIMVQTIHVVNMIIEIIKITMCKDYKIVMCMYGRYEGYEHSLFFNYNSYLLRFVTSSLFVIDGQQKAHHKLIKVETNASACLKVGQGIPTKIIS